MNCKAATNRKGVNTIMTKTRRRKNCQQLKICNILEMMELPKWWFLGVFRDPSGLGIVISVYKRVQTFLDLNTPQRKVENPSEFDVKYVSQSEIPKLNFLPCRLPFNFCRLYSWIDEGDKHSLWPTPDRYLGAAAAAEAAACLKGKVLCCQYTWLPTSVFYCTCGKPLYLPYKHCIVLPTCADGKPVKYTWWTSITRCTSITWGGVVQRFPWETAQ